ncbi:calcium-transporting ATPase 12, plasma membrane-type-like protein [Tanacetum coccineum]
MATRSLRCIASFCSYTDSKRWSFGLSIKMITGDNVFTAKAIATEYGILKAGQLVTESEVIKGHMVAVTCHAIDDAPAPFYVFIRFYVNRAML